MDNKAYLEQISSEARTTKASKMPFGLNISPKLLKLLIGGFIAAILIIIIGAIAGSGGSSERDYLDKIFLRTANLSSSISDYNKRVKSSELRSMGNSLNAVLTETNYSVGNILKNDFGVSSPNKPANEKTETEETEWIDGLNQDLENGRLNGVLDRVYSRDLAYEIGILISLESETVAKSKNDTVKTSLTSSMDNLSKLYDQFNDFEAN